MGEVQSGGDYVVYPAWADGGMTQQLQPFDQDCEAVFILSG
ncbi:hypothetical protein OOK41_10450 [Micromonospora sp. NBC_01655]|nr:hypothetical protein [Micromonospora sp. NBC_01655]MCX4470720.1 hypothetical protein [Micromonospora sp. NBC_01655]